MPFTPLPYAFTGSGFDDLKEIENKLANINEKLDPFANLKDKVGQIPFYSTGARALLKVGGKSFGVAQSITWNIMSNAEAVHTVDSPFPWDIDVGLVKISATISDVMDPTAGPEAKHLFNIMPAIVHQPMVEMQVIDSGIGTSIFFARGMFTGISGSVQRGQISNFSATFTGVAYQHYVVQNFKPYNGLGAIGGVANDLLNTAAGLLGGL